MINISDSDKVDQNEDVLINFYYYIFDFDYRSGLFTDESSIYDMGSCGLKDADFETIADNYENQVKDKTLSYKESTNLYYKLSQEYWFDIIKKKSKDIYNIELDQNGRNLLIDVIDLLKESNPNKNWARDNIFIIKKFDVIEVKKYTEIFEATKDLKVVKLPVKKKLSKEDVLSSTNFFLIASELNISYEEAKVIADKNMEIKTQGKIFKPYRPSVDD